VLVLLGGGAVLGRLSAGAPLFGSFASGEEQLTEMPLEGVPLPPLPPDASLPRVAVIPSPDLAPAAFGSVEDARNALERYEMAYRYAARYLADHDSTISDLPRSIERVG
jgi:hypothetical protein